jgi:protein O-mannosyl-transferase
VVGAIVTYGRTFSVPPLLDDQLSVFDNSTIRHWNTAFLPPIDSTTSGRPILNASLAVNYAISGTAVWSYHALNLAIHVVAGLTLFGIVRRTLARLKDPAAVFVAFSAALLWILHPLQTESVTYIVQRAESLVGMFYLITLYCFIRGTEADPYSQRRWFTATVATCLLGMATKEVMVSAPLTVLLYDRTFVAGSFRAAWQRHRVLYLGLTFTWVLLAAIMVGSHNRNETAGFGLGVSPWDYGATQCRAIVLYLKLSVWPHPLVVDYGTALVPTAREVWPQALLLILLAAGTLLSLWRRSALGFAGAWFLGILAPSSSVVPVVTQTIAEHRMYLPLAAVTTLAALGIHATVGRRSWGVFAVLALGLGMLTARRNEDYSTGLAIWSDTVAKRPSNERAHYNLGRILSEVPGRLDDAIAQYEEALRLNPGYAEAHYNLGLLWAQTPARLNDAITQFAEAVRLKPDFAEARYNLGVACLQMPGRLNDAIIQLEEAIRLKPGFAETHYNLGVAWLQMPGRLNDAVAQFQEALRLNPNYAETHYNLGVAWLQMPGRLNDAVAQLQEALRLNPNYAEAHNNLGVALLQTPGRLNDAIAQYDEALRLNPDYAEAHYNLGLLWSQTPGRLNDAITQFGEAVRLKPDFALAWHGLGASRFQSGNLPAAAEAFREELRLSPNNPAAQQALAAALQQAKDQ